MDRRRIGLLGGSFDPVHLGHLRMAEEVREAAALAEVRLVLAAQPPHKEHGAVAGVDERRLMLELALADVEHLRIETCEIERHGPSYTIDTIEVLQRRTPEAEWALILGADAFRHIASWHRYEELLATSDVIVASRPPAHIERGPGGIHALGLPIAVQEAFGYDSRQECFRHRSGRRLDLVAVTGLDISSSKIRSLVRAGRSIRFLTPPAVAQHIATRGLYSEA